MTGNPNFKHDFTAAADVLTKEGYVVLNPATHPSGLSYEAYMRIDMAMLKECDAICLLPGWLDSRGASFEKHLAEILGLKVFYFNEWLRDTIVANWLKNNNCVPRDTMRDLQNKKEGANKNDFWRKNKEIKNRGGVVTNSTRRQNRRRNKQKRK